MTDDLRVGALVYDTEVRCEAIITDILTRGRDRPEYVLRPTHAFGGEWATTDPARLTPHGDHPCP